MYQKSCPWKKVTKMQNNIVKCSYSAQKVILRALYCFLIDLQSRWWCKLGCNCLKALLTLTEARLKDPRYRQNKSFYELLCWVPNLYYLDSKCSLCLWRIPVSSLNSYNLKTSWLFEELLKLSKTFKAWNHSSFDISAKSEKN